ncbi:transmembrane 220 family protein [Pontibacter sp. HSC-36F09]|uniref:transmembrane 220 family protein n=1 Tax=Pontibacter sp. HSC-36F09 TaxID=2910966 RepID=UPI00209D30B0|nr:transmembrane 220 family protein [Pontibacter sp. HSC-36F09]MCP2044795.1 membrane-bound ClpP family serine protease [Pontibacter sp. HSC-36F09]
MAIKQILSTFMGIVFIVFAAMQYNDLDAVVWIAIYLVAAIFSFLVAFNRINQTILFIAFAAYAVGAVFFWPAKWEGITICGGDIKNIEEAREFLGLAINSITMLTFALLSRSRARLHPRKPIYRQGKWAN